MHRSFQHGVNSLCNTLLTLVWVCGLIDRTSAQQTVLDNQVVIGQWSEYEAFSRGIQGSYRDTMTSDSGKTTNQTLRFKQNGDCIIIRDLLPDSNKETITLANPLYSAELRNSTVDSSKVVLVQYAPRQRGVISSGGVTPSFETVFIESSPHFTYCRFRLPELASKRSFHIKQVSEELVGETKLVRVDHEFEYEEPRKKYQRKGVIYFDPSHKWCIRQIKDTEVIYHNGDRYRTTAWDVRYEVIDHSSGFPLVKSILTTWDSRYERSGKKSKGTIRREYELESNDRVPETEFTLSAFGLPEPIGINQPRRTPVFVWVLASAAVCVIFAIGFRQLARRRRAVPTG